MKVDETKSKNLAFGSKATTYKDIGVDLCKTKGGWGWFTGEVRTLKSCNMKGLL